MKHLTALFLLACLTVARGVNPSFDAFNTNQFATTGNRVAIKSGALATNLVVTGMTNNGTYTGAKNIVPVDDNQYSFGDPNLRWKNAYIFDQIIGGTFIGNGSGLTNLNAANLASGTIPVGRLATNTPATSGNEFLQVTGDNRKWQSNSTLGGTLTVNSTVTANGNFVNTQNGVTGTLTSNRLDVATIVGTASLNALGATNLNVIGNQTNRGVLDVSGGITSGSGITGSTLASGGNVQGLIFRGTTAAGSFTNGTSTTTIITVLGTNFLVATSNGLTVSGALSVTNAATIRTNTALFDVSTTDFVLGTRYTNSNRRAWVSGSFSLAAAVAGTATVTLYVEHGTTITNKLTVSAGPLASLSVTEQLGLPVPPNGFYYFADEDSGSGAASAVVAGTCSVTGL